MRISGLQPFALNCVAAALLAGCGGGQPAIGAPDATPQTHTIAGHAQRVGSWMSLASAKDNLLFISDEGTSDVYVYSLSKYRLVGTLTGFSEPRGLCLNKAGDIWIPNAGDSNLLEYAPGGTTPIGSLNDPGEYPVDCAVDTTTGDLAASNIISSKPGPGSLSIYSNAIGAPAVVPAFGHTYHDAYDPSGNLFVDGVTADGAFQFGEIARGEKTVTNLKLKGAVIGAPTNVQYADGNLAIGDDREYSSSVIYQVAVSGTTARVIGRTPLHHAHVIAFFILGHRVFCLNSTKYGSVHIAIYKYPAGGEATRTIQIPGLSLPVGLVVSPVAN